MKKTILTLLVSITILFVHSQDSNSNSKQEILELKLELLETKLKLLEPTITNYESQSETLKNEMVLFENKVAIMKDSIKILLNNVESKKNSKDSTIQKYEAFNCKNVIKFNPMRLFEGSFLVSYERSLGRKWSLEAGFMGTYVTKEGIGGGYLAKQDLEAYNFADNSYYSYSGDVFNGYGIFVKGKNYLEPQIKAHKSAPLGLYAAPQFMFRNIEISGYRTVWDDSTYTQKEISKNLNVFGFGLIIGGQYQLAQVLSIEVYAGGVLRFSKYSDEDDFTKYKSWNNIDYSGVLPTFGVNIGILK